MDLSPSDIEEIGFDRPCTKDVNGSLSIVDIHLVMMTGVPHTDWPAKGEVSPLHGAITNLIKSAKSQLPNITMTVCDALCRKQGTMDIFVYHRFDPKSGFGIVGLTTENMHHLVPFLSAIEDAGESSIESGSEFKIPETPLQIETLPYTTSILTCAHVQRDQRCGYCGSVIHDAIVKEIDERGLKGKIFAGRVSHVGGHSYAANVIVYPQGAWYGYMKPSDVPRLFDDYLEKGELLKDKLRGKLGLDKEQNRLLAIESEF